jgi:hypothetical protein
MIFYEAKEAVHAVVGRITHVIYAMPRTGFSSESSVNRPKVPCTLLLAIVMRRLPLLSWFIEAVLILLMYMLSEFVLLHGLCGP